MPERKAPDPRVTATPRRQMTQPPNTTSKGDDGVDAPPKSTSGDTVPAVASVADVPLAAVPLTTTQPERPSATQVVASTATAGQEIARGTGAADRLRQAGMIPGDSKELDPFRRTTTEAKTPTAQQMAETVGGASAREVTLTGASSRPHADHGSAAASVGLPDPDDTTPFVGTATPRSPVAGDPRYGADTDDGQQAGDADTGHEDDGQQAGGADTGHEGEQAEQEAAGLTPEEQEKAQDERAQQELWKKKETLGTVRRAVGSLWGAIGGGGGPDNDAPNAGVGIRGTPTPDSPESGVGPGGPSSDEILMVTNRFRRKVEPTDKTPSDPGGDEFGTAPAHSWKESQESAKALAAKRSDPYTNPQPEGDRPDLDAAGTAPPDFENTLVDPTGLPDGSPGGTALLEALPPTKSGAPGEDGDDDGSER